MYNKITRQSLPEEEYIELLGIALSVFSSNNGFIIENIVRTNNSFNWFDLIDKPSGKLKEDIRKTISEKNGSDEIVNLFSEIVCMRNRIIHGFRITSKDGKQIIGTKNPGNNIQFEITSSYLIDFIKKNEKLSDLLHEYRGF